MRAGSRAWIWVTCCAAAWLGVGVQAAQSSDPLDQVVRELRDPSVAVRTRAAVVFVNRQPDESSQRRLPALMAAARTERDASVRAMLVMALGNTGAGHEEVVAALTDILAHDHDPEVRQRAAQSLGRLGLDPPRSVDALVAALQDPVDEVRGAAASALGAPAFDAGPLVARSVPALAAMLAEPSGDAWSHAAQALRDLGVDAAPALPALRALMKQGGYRRRLAAEAMAAMASYAAPAAPECLAALQDADPETRVEAAIALLAMGQSRQAAFAVLTRSLEFAAGGGADARNQRNAVVTRAAWAAGQYAAYAPPSTAPLLAGLSADPESDVRRFAGAALDKVVAALVGARRGDALQALQGTRETLLRLDDGARAATVAEGIEALQSMRPWPLGRDLRTTLWAGALAAAVVGLAAALRRMRRKSARVDARAPRVLLSYRREDSAALCGRVYDRLVQRWAAPNVFRDLDSLQAGDPFAQRIGEAIRACDAVVVFIGRRWDGARGPGEGRRIDDANDFVRQEVAESLAQGKRVIPVLHDGAGMPAPEGLPPDIAALAGLQAIELTESHFDADMARLEGALAATASESVPASAWRAAVDRP